MAQNPDYGVALSEEAARTLHEIYPNFECVQKPFSRVKLEKKKRPVNRTKSHRLTISLDDEAYQRFEVALKSAAITSKQEFLEKVLEDYYEHQ